MMMLKNWHEANVQEVLRFVEAHKNWQNEEKVNGEKSENAKQTGMK